jgi:hypothetical protein
LFSSEWTGIINHSNFFDQEIDEIWISNEDVPYDDRLYNLIDYGKVPEKTYELINQMTIIPNKSITLEFLNDLGLFTSDKQ